MIEHPNSLLIHQCLQAVTDGDTDTLRALWDENIVFHVAGASPWHGEIKGVEAVFEYLAVVGEAGSSVDTSIGDVMVSNHRASLICHVKAQAGSRTLDTEYVLIARIGRRRIQEVWSIPLEPERVAAFWEAEARA